MSQPGPSYSPGEPSRPPLYFTGISRLPGSPSRSAVSSPRVSHSGRRISKGRTSAYESFDAPAYCNDMAAYIAEQLALKPSRPTKREVEIEAYPPDKWRGSSLQRGQAHLADVSVQTEVHNSGEEEEDDDDHDRRALEDIEARDAEVDDDDELDMARTARTKEAAESFLKQLQEQPEELTETEKAIEEQVFSFFAGVPKPETESQPEEKINVDPEVAAQIAGMLAQPVKNTGPLIQEVLAGTQGSNSSEDEEGIAEEEDEASEEEDDDGSDDERDEDDSDDQLQSEENDFDEKDQESEGSSSQVHENGGIGKSAFMSGEAIELLDSDEEEEEEEGMMEEYELELQPMQNLYANINPPDEEEEERMEEMYADGNEALPEQLWAEEEQQDQAYSLEVDPSSDVEETVETERPNPNSQSFEAILKAPLTYDEVVTSTPSTAVMSQFADFSSSSPSQPIQRTDEVIPPTLSLEHQHTEHGSDLISLKEGLEQRNLNNPQPHSVDVHPGTPLPDAPAEEAKHENDGHARHASDLFHIKSVAQRALHGRASLATSLASEVDSAPRHSDVGSIGQEQVISAEDVLKGELVKDGNGGIALDAYDSALDATLRSEDGAEISSQPHHEPWQDEIPKAESQVASDVVDLSAEAAPANEVEEETMPIQESVSGQDKVQDKFAGYIREEIVQSENDGSTVVETLGDLDGNGYEEMVDFEADVVVEEKAKSKEEEVEDAAAVDQLQPSHSVDDSCSPLESINQLEDQRSETIRETQSQADGISRDFGNVENEEVIPADKEEMQTETDAKGDENAEKDDQEESKFAPSLSQEEHDDKESGKKKRRSRHSRHKSDASGDLADYVPEPEEEEEMDDDTDLHRPVKRAKSDVGEELNTVEEKREEEDEVNEGQEDEEIFDISILEESEADQSQSQMDVDESRIEEDEEEEDDDADKKAASDGPATRTRRKRTPRKSNDPAFKLTKVEDSESDEEAKRERIKKEEQAEKKKAADRERRRIQREAKKKEKEALKKEEKEAERAAAGLKRTRRVSEDAKTFRPATAEGEDEEEEAAGEQAQEEEEKEKAETESIAKRRNKRRVSRAPSQP